MTPRRPGRPQPENAVPKTALQLARRAAMANANERRGVTQAQIHRACLEAGHEISISTVQAVLLDKFDDAVVQQIFTDLTGTEMADMFPGTAAERRLLP